MGSYKYLAHDFSANKISDKEFKKRIAVEQKEHPEAVNNFIQDITDKATKIAAEQDVYNTLTEMYHKARLFDLVVQHRLEHWMNDLAVCGKNTKKEVREDIKRVLEELK